MKHFYTLGAIIVLKLGLSLTSYAGNVNEALAAYEELKAQSRERAKAKVITEGESQTAEEITTKKETPKEKVVYLSRNGSWTYLYERSILYIPSSLQRYVTNKPKGQPKNWKEFYRKNSSIFHLHRVTNAQSQGQDKVTPLVIRGYKSHAKIVVATLNGGPVTMSKKAFEPEVAQ